jgi:ABC-2 type transport system permease protein
MAFRHPALFGGGELRELMKAIRLAWVFLRIGVMNELQYRVNFFVQILESLIAVATGLIGLGLVFNQVDELNSWTRPELLAVMGVHILMGGVINALIQPNMMRLMDEIRDGTLDFPLSKPVDAQLLISVRTVGFWRLTDVIIGLLILGVSVRQFHQNLGIGSAIMFALILIMGGTIIYCFWLMLSSTAFWVIRANNMVELFQGLYAAGRWPVGIYPNWLRYGLTFIVPVAFAVTIPAEALTGRLTLPTVLGTTLLTVVFLFVTRVVWRAGLRNYAGASA